MEENSLRFTDRFCSDLIVVSLELGPTVMQANAT